MKMSLKEWDSYRFTILLQMGCPRQEAPRMRGFRCSASSLFYCFSGKIPCWGKHVGGCCVCAPTAELLVRWKSQQMAQRRGSPPLKCTGMSHCRPNAVMQMPNWWSTSGNTLCCSEGPGRRPSYQFVTFCPPGVSQLFAFQLKNR